MGRLIWSEDEQRSRPREFYVVCARRLNEKEKKAATRSLPLYGVCMVYTYHCGLRVSIPTQLCLL